jgi:hypothetical protein
VRHAFSSSRPKPVTTEDCQYLGADVGELVAQMGSLSVEYRNIVASITSSLHHLGPRGWGSIAYMQTEAVNEAVELVARGRGDEADDVLAGQWEDEGDWRLKRVCDRVRVMGASDDELQPLFRELRWRASP